MTAAEALRAAVATLRAAGLDDPARDARRLLAHAMGIAPDRMTLHLTDALPPAAARTFEAAITDRARFRPVSQITGWRDFYGHRFRVTADTLDPRPETEVLVEVALERPAARMLDLGTGTGCVLLSCLAARGAMTGLGTDLSAPALGVAADNAARLGLQARAAFREADWFGGPSGLGERFDLITSNPPYITAAEMAALAPDVRLWEPHLALTPGGDGLAAYRAIAAGAGAHLTPGGRIALETGPAQGGAVAGLLAGAGFAAPELRRDLDGRDRVVLAVWPGVS